MKTNNSLTASSGSVNTDNIDHKRFVNSDDIRHEFAMAMSAMYQQEVPLYGDLIDLVTDINTKVLSAQPDIKAQLEHTEEINRLNKERHGAIRLGTESELNMMRRLFAVLGMYPVGYYDLAPAGVPVHSTAFRAIDAQALNNSPFRVFTSLLRLDLINDDDLKQQDASTLANRNIFTAKAVKLIERFESQGGLTPAEAKAFVTEALETFRWHDKAPISKPLYEQLSNQHALIADVVGFQGPHINHLTPRTLDIDAVQQGMQARGIAPKAIIEGPPKRNCPILLRQTSFKALQEAVSFKKPSNNSNSSNNNADGNSENDSYERGHHTARFGEIEQRGVALTPKGRALYDKLLNEARSQLKATPNADNASKYYQLLEQSFSAFPDNYYDLHKAELAYFYYQPVTDSTITSSKVESERLAAAMSNQVLTALIDKGIIRLEPIVYEDFLPVSAAGIFQSNLHDDNQSSYNSHSNQKAFEQALGTTVYDELKLYESLQEQSLKQCLALLKQDVWIG